MDWIDEEASARAGGQIALRGIWRQSIERLAALEIPPEDARKLAAACREPSDALLLSRLLGPSAYGPGTPETRAQALLEAADDSDHSLAEWIEAMRSFYAWLDAQKRRTPLPKALGYIHCSAEGMAGDRRFASLADGVRDMLRAYGFEGAED